jgi:hypothetical protein
MTLDTNWCEKAIQLLIKARGSSWGNTGSTHKPAFIVLFGGRKSEDFAENPLPRISMFTNIVVSSVQLMKGGGRKVEGERLKGTRGIEPLNIVRCWIRTIDCREPLDREPKMIPLSYHDYITMVKVCISNATLGLTILSVLSSTHITIKLVLEPKPILHFCNKQNEQCFAKIREL